MNIDQFWNVIAQSRPDDAAHPEDCEERLKKLLTKLEAEEIVEWNHIFDRLVADAYTCNMIAACLALNSGAGDDGFYYFRCWLVGMGRQVYENAMRDPDTLADVPIDLVTEDAEAEIYAVAHFAWMEVTGNPYEHPYPARNESAELKGEDWDVNDEAECRKRMPRLEAKCNGEA